jgi:hypothetical protein
MTQDEFWEHVRATRRIDPDEHAERLAARLARLDVEDILSFGRWWHRSEVAAYSWELWGAAYLINGGCSDDGFEYFCNWLILQGRDVFEAAVKEPDSLAKVLRGDAEVEADCHPAYDAYCAVTGQADYAEELSRHYPDLPERPPLKKIWDFDDTDAMRGRYPKLYAAYLGE